jgi:hypothetical protein
MLMQPKKAMTNLPAGVNVSAFVQGGKSHIRKDVDEKFRKVLTEAVNREANFRARFHISNALHNGPSRGGVDESITFFGDELSVKLALTAEIVDALEISVPGFKKWLELTGFANDKTMIRGFVEWAEFKNGRGKVMTNLADIG